MDSIYLGILIFVILLLGTILQPIMFKYLGISQGMLTEKEKDEKTKYILQSDLTNLKKFKQPIKLKDL